VNNITISFCSPRPLCNSFPDCQLPFLGQILSNRIIAWISLSYEKCFPISGGIWEEMLFFEHIG
jgi:hypothetical protein